MRTKIDGKMPKVEGFGEVWSRLIKASKLRVCDHYDKPWFSIDTLEQLTLRNND